MTPPAPRHYRAESLADFRKHELFQGITSSCAWGGGETILCQGGSCISQGRAMGNPALGALGLRLELSYPILGDCSILIPSCSSGLQSKPLPCSVPQLAPHTPGIFGLEMTMHTKGPASPFYAAHGGENQMVPCFFQAFGSLLGVFLRGMRGQFCLTKGGDFGGVFFLALILSYFYSFFHPVMGQAVNRVLSWPHFREAFAGIEGMGYY